MPSETVSGDVLQLLSFFVAGEEYAVRTLEVKELIQYTPVTRMPSMPSFVRGVANHRGSVVPVLDLAARFGFPPTVITKWTCIVMLDLATDGESSTVGVLADSVSQVVDLTPGDVEPPPRFGTQAAARFLRGMGRIGSKFLLILDPSSLLATEEQSLTPPVSSPPAPEAD